jgi:tetratricopeptide (TPR) repeat protein
MRANPSAANRLAFSLDTALHALKRGNVSAGRAAIQRGLARYPTDSMPPDERPWHDLAELAGALGDAPLSRLALAGYDRDLALTSSYPAGERAFFSAHVALAEKRWDDAVRLLHEADAKFGIEARYAMSQLGRAHDQAGRSDSAVVYYEKFLSTPDPQPIHDARARAETYGRLGELYDAAGNTRKAMEHYGQFVKLWAPADPPLQAQVAEVRKRLEQLRQQVG